MELLLEYNFHEIETISESADGVKKWYIEGIYAQSDIINRNRRLYPHSVLYESMEDYINNFVKTNRSVGELDHPDTPRGTKSDRVSHRIVEMKEDGKNYVGKSLIYNTPCGKVVQGLLEGGTSLGISTRATAKTSQRGSITEVCSPLRMKAIDIVLDPSAPEAFMTAIMEDAPFLSTIHEASEEFIHSLKEDLDKNSAYKLQEKRLEVFKKFMDVITENTNKS